MTPRQVVGTAIWMAKRKQASPARSSLMAFNEAMYPGYIGGDHIDRLVSALEAVERGEITRLIVTMPPRFSKSLNVSEHFPAWFLGRNPDKRIIASSHTASLSYTFSRRVRNKLQHPGWPFPEVGIAGDKAGVTAWDIAGRKGGYLSVGVGGSPTGHGADCLTADTRILTYNGYVPIARLVQTGGMVLGFDHETSEPVWRPIEAARIVRPKDIYELVTESGHRIRGTGNHLVFVEGRGYRPLSELRRGDVLVSVRPVRGVVHEDEVRDSEGGAARERVPVLLSGMRTKASQPAWENEVLPGVSRSCATQSGDVLLRYVRSGGARGTTGGTNEDVPAMWRCISPEVASGSVLFQDVCGRGALGAYAGQAERELQGRDELREVVPVHASADSGARPRAMRGVWEAGSVTDVQTFRDAGAAVESPDSPHQREPGGQRPRQSDYALQDVPWETPSVSRDAVAVVRHLRGRSEPVYDIQVAGCRNFFAEGVLVHNCLIIDDPIRSAADADSETVRESLWEWYQGTLRTRLQPGGAMILTATRWRHDDLTGRLLTEMGHGGEQWVHLHMPAITEDGVSLWPEFWPTDALGKIQQAVGSRVWQSQYMGAPTPAEGGILKRHWFGVYAQPEQRYLALIQSWDTSFKDGRTADYSACVTLGVGLNYVDVLDVYRARLEFPDLERALEEQHLIATSRYPGVPITVLVEDKGSGQSLIQVARRRGNRSLNVIAVSASRPDEKVQRVHDISPSVEAGKVRLPTHAHWLDAFVDEVVAFPLGSHDDQVDGFSTGASRAFGVGPDSSPAATSTSGFASTPRPNHPARRRA